MEKRINSLSGGGSARKRKTRPPFFIALHQSEEFSSSRKNAILIHCVEGAVCVSIGLDWAATVCLICFRFYTLGNKLRESTVRPARKSFVSPCAPIQTSLGLFLSFLL